MHRDRSQGTFGLSQNSYIEKVLKRFSMQEYKPGDTHMAKGDKFSLNQCPKNDFKVKEMQRIPYALAVGTLMYAQVCKLGRYLSNSGMDHWKAAKWIIWYLQRTKHYTPYTGNQINWRSLDILIPILPDAKTVRDSCGAIYTYLLEELFLGSVLSRHS